MPLKNIIAEATSPEHFEAFTGAIESFFVKAQLDQLSGNPGKLLTALVKEQVLDPALALLKWTGTKEAQSLYDAYCDVKIYGTGCAQAAEEAGADAADLAWLLSKEDVPKESLKVSSALKKRRERKLKKGSK